MKLEGGEELWWDWQSCIQQYMQGVGRRVPSSLLRQPTKTRDESAINLDQLLEHT